MSEYEVRTFPVGELRIVDGDDGRPRLEGRAIVYDALSEDFGSWRERFAPGSVRLDDDLLALFDHDTSMVLGRTTAGTLEAMNGPEGVDIRAFPPDTSWYRDMRVSMERGDIRHMSFRFRPVKDDVAVVDGQVVRTVLDAEVSEVSVVSMPAYPQTTAELRSRVEALREAVPTPSVTDAEETGGSPAEAAPEGGSPERIYMAGGRIITLHDTPKGE